MSKKSIFLLFILSFVNGLFLIKMLTLISDNISFSMNEYEFDQGEEENFITNEDSGLEIIQLENSRKAIRGNYFEAIVYCQSERRIYGTYNLVVHLVSLEDKQRINAGKYRIESIKGWPKKEIIKIGPLRISLPEETPLGNYTVEVGLLKEGDTDSKINYKKGSIEVVSYN